MAALKAANSSAYTKASLPSQSGAAQANLARPQANQSLPTAYHPNWLQAQAAVHAHRPMEPMRNAAPNLPQHSSWVEVKPESAGKALSHKQEQDAGCLTVNNMP